MTDFKFAKECSEKGIEFSDTDWYFRKYNDNIRLIPNCKYLEEANSTHFMKAEYYPNPSEEELSKRLPNVIEKLNERINKKEFIEVMKWDFVIEEYTYRFQFEYNNNVIREKVSGKTKKECYQKAIILLNDMELLK